MPGGIQHLAHLDSRRRDRRVGAGGLQEPAPARADEDHAEQAAVLERLASAHAARQMLAETPIEVIMLYCISPLYSNMRFKPKAVKLKFTKKEFFNFLSKKSASPPVIITFKFV